LASRSGDSLSNSFRTESSQHQGPTWFSRFVPTRRGTEAQRKEAEQRTLRQPAPGSKSRGACEKHRGAADSPPAAQGGARLL
jgi:hypothetical protein